MEFRLGELFCGAGGLALGAKCAQVTDAHGENFCLSHAWANDYHADACNTYRHNICPNQPHSVLCQDVRTLEPQALENIAFIDAFAFGFPCNDFSAVGERKGIQGQYGPLYRYGVMMLNHFQPKFFVAENVSGLQNSNDGATFAAIIMELEQAGYMVYPHIYHFEHYGVPQARHRIILVGIRKDLPIVFCPPAPYTEAFITCREAIESPPIPLDAPNNGLTQQSRQVVERLKHILPGENAFTATLPKELRLNVKGATISQIYRRLDPNKPAYTITGSGGGGTHVYHWSENRALTNRERARLQTFPDDFAFCGSKESVRRQIGMAVPPRAAQIIFEAILKCFAGVAYPSCRINLPSKTLRSPLRNASRSQSKAQLNLWDAL